MPTTRQVRPHVDRNVVPEDVRSGRCASTCPLDASDFEHMRADRSVLA